MVAGLEDRIPLSVKGIVKEQIKFDELNTRKYTFSSISAFNISVDLIYGSSLKVTVYGPDQTIIE